MISISSSDYRMDLIAMINKVYNSKHRELLREFFAYSNFKDLFLSQSIETIDDELQHYLTRGYSYLSSQESEGFVDFTFDDNNINFNQANLDTISQYILSNAYAHLYAAIVLWLLDHTDIEEHLDQTYHLIAMSKWYLRFDYRR